MVSCNKYINLLEKSNKIIATKNFELCRDAGNIMNFLHLVLFLCLTFRHKHEFELFEV